MLGATALQGGLVTLGRAPQLPSAHLLTAGWKAHSIVLSGVWGEDVQDQNITLKLHFPWSFPSLAVEVTLFLEGSLRKGDWHLPAFVILRKCANDIHMFLGPRHRKMPFLCWFFWELPMGTTNTRDRNSPSLAVMWTCHCCSKAGFESSDTFHDKGSEFGHLLYLPRCGRNN